MNRWIYVGTIICLLVFILPSSPIHLSYVYSNSMEPTIMQGDGYLVVPTGTIEAGDILTYYSEERSEHVTHRVVEITEDGFITQGDNNPSTDQSAGYPLVTSEEVLGKVATISGQPLVLPYFGTVVAFIQTHWKLGVGLLIVTSGLTGGKTRTRDIVRFRSLLIPLVVMAIIGSSAAFVLGAPTSTLTFIASDTAEPGDHIIPVGESATRTVDVEFSGRPAYTHEFIEATGLTLTAGEQTTQISGIQVRVPPQRTPGPYQASIQLYRYPAVLPYGVVSPLQAIHPLLAAVATMSAIIGPLYLLVWVFVDGKQLLHSRSRRRPFRNSFR
ncbi:signal peptidase I [Haloprofundus sp. MHR1]|uniref:signal peptidase I n=1 Tax=Haloprofundus sp. MHR1 TaxID=2572921 RepID=UPI0010BE5E34|nr:signal peptidase I [Haloprofundus sp. MHR1]QCJ45982.1 signal peptidase I [Haloprofundus sp. MHR1]